MKIKGLFKKKPNKRKNTLEIKYLASLEEEVKVKDKLIKLQDKVISLKEEIDIKDKTILELKERLKKGNK